MNERVIYETHIRANDGRGDDVIAVMFDDHTNNGYVWNVTRQLRLNPSKFTNVSRDQLDHVIARYEQYHADKADFLASLDDYIEG